MTEKLRVLLVGAGDMGHHHAPAWENLGHQLHTIVDINRDRADEVAQKYNAMRTFYGERDYLTALDDEIDVVDICVPLELHAPITIAAAERGKHIFCEKPIARNFHEVELMENAVQSAGVKFGLGFQRNLASGVDKLKEWADADVFGRPRIFSCDLLQEVRPKRFMHNRYSNNGPIVDACCHDFLLWKSVFRSKPKSVFARGGILGQGRQEISHIATLAMDSAVITVEFESGDIGTMTVSWGLEENTPLSGRPERIIGPKGGAEMEKMKEFGWPGVYLYHEGEKSYHDLPQKDVFVEEISGFVDSIRGMREAPIYGFLEGKEMLAVSLAALDSIDTGKVVPVATYL